MAQGSLFFCLHTGKWVDMQGNHSEINSRIRNENFWFPYLLLQGMDVVRVIVILWRPGQTLIFPQLIENKPHHFNPLPDDKMLDWSKLKQTADDFLKYI